VPVANQPENKPWQVEVSELLARAAELCAAQEVDLDSFVRGACSAYLEARPGMREHLAEMQLRLQLDEMRKLGRIATA
jgi:hypothetical protein